MRRHSGILCAVMAALLPSLASAQAPAVQVAPKSDAQILLGLSHLHQGRFAQGQLQFRAYMENHPGDPRGHLFLAFCEWWRLLQVGAEPRTDAMEYHLQEAIRLAQARLAESPEDPEALTSVGTAFIFLAEYRASEHRVFKAASAARKGKSYLDKASRLQPDQVDSQFGLGAYNYYADKVNVLVKGLRTILFLPGGNSELGLSQLEEVSRRGRYFRTEAHLLLAVIDQGRYERRYQASLEHLRQALELNQESPIILGSIGELQMRLGRYPESQRVLQRAIAQCEGSQDREIEHLGRLLRILAAESLDLSLHSEEAVAELSRAARGSDLQPEWRNRALNVATRATLRLGNPRLLQDFLEQIDATPAERQALVAKRPELASTDPQLVREIGPVLRLLEGPSPEEALPLLTELLKSHPDSPELLFHRARLSFRQGKWLQAQAYLMKIPPTTTRTPPWVLGWTHLFLGRCLWQQGETEKANEAYKRALEVQGFRGKDLARALQGPEATDPGIWPKEIFASGLQASENPRNVSTGFPVRGNSTVAVDRLLPGIVGGQGEGRVLVPNQQLLEIAGPAFEVLARVENILDLEAQCGLRHELHETHRPAP